MSPISTLALLLKMIRWRVALVLIMFMLVGAAWHGFTLGYQLLLAVVGLAVSYACATTVNDLVDYEIDKINLPKDPDRLLVSGRATRSDLVKACLFTSLIAVVCGFFISPLAALLFLAAIGVNLAYSLPPIQISHRPLLTPLYLPLGYVVIPFLIGAITTGSSLAQDDGLILLAFYLLFLGRIILKDFRDRKGDAACGKRTFLLTYGKTVTVATSILSIAIGYLLLITAMYERVGAVSVLLTVFAATNLIMLMRLQSIEEGKSEQVAIGIGAKMGNGMLLTVLGLLVLQSRSAPADTLLVLALFFIFLYSFNFVMALRHPQQAVIAYKA